MQRTTSIRSAALPLLLMISLPLLAATERQRQVATSEGEIQKAAAAMAMAEKAGAPIYAKSMYDDAAWRLRSARENQNSDKSGRREDAALRAIQARVAAQAAEKKALWAAAVAEASQLTSDVIRFGGTLPDMRLAVEPDAAVDRGSVSMDKIRVAEQAIADARAAGGAAIAPQDLKDAETMIWSAKKILQNQKQSDSAEHLAYVAEMTARRLFYEAKLADVQKMLPGLRLERTRLEKVASDRQAADEAARRQQAEQEAAALRTQVNSLQQQNLQRQAELRAQVDADRAARLAAEARLNDLLIRYQQMAGTASPSDLDAMQRQLNDQQAELEAVRQKQTAAEQGLGTEVDRLQQALADEKARGTASAEELRQRQASIDAQRAELDRMRAEREDSERRLTELRRQNDQAVAQVTQLQQQVAQEKQKSEQTSAELQKTREELARRDAAEKERARLQSELAAIAATTSDARGLVVTLPGIFFDTGKSSLKPGARNTLQKIAGTLSSSPNLKILVEGHTDSVGSEESNLALSTRRAEAVREALVSLGIPAAAITTSGRGESTPVATNSTAAGRQQNRRVELVITQ